MLVLSWLELVIPSFGVNAQSWRCPLSLPGLLHCGFTRCCAAMGWRMSWVYTTSLQVAYPLLPNSWCGLVSGSGSLRSFLALWSIMLASTITVMVQFCDSGWETPAFSSVLNPLLLHKPCRQLALSFLSRTQGGLMSCLPAISRHSREPRAWPQANWYSKHPLRWLLLFSVPCWLPEVPTLKGVLPSL